MKQGCSCTLSLAECWHAVDPKQIHKICSGGKHDMTTFICMTNSLGDVVAPMIMFKGQSVKSNVTQDCAIKDILATATENGYMDDVTFLKYLQMWYKNVDQTKPHLLILDNHWSHIGIRSSQWAKANNVHILGFPGNSTHMLQPQDQVVFAVLKKVYRGQYTEFTTRYPHIKYGKKAFLMVLGAKFYEAFSKNNIKASFRTTGCWPLSLDRMLFQLSKIQGKQCAPISLPQEDPLGVIAQLLQVPDHGVQLKTRSKKGKRTQESTIYTADDMIEKQEKKERNALFKECIKVASRLAPIRAAKFAEQEAAARAVMAESANVSKKCKQALKEQERDRAKQQLQEERAQAKAATVQAKAAATAQAKKAVAAAMAVKKAQAAAARQEAQEIKKTEQERKKLERAALAAAKGSKRKSNGTDPPSKRARMQDDAALPPLLPQELTSCPIPQYHQLPTHQQEVELDIAQLMAAWHSD